MNNITPIYIFDGIPPKEKMDTINQRKEKFYENIDKLKELQSELETTENMDIDATEQNVSEQEKGKKRKRNSKKSMNVSLEENS